MLVCSFVCANRTRDRGCSKHPVFPAPSVSRRANEDANLGRKAPRDREVIPCIATASTPSSLRTQGPIRRGGCCLAMMVDGLPSTMSDGGYRSLRSHGRPPPRNHVPRRFLAQARRLTYM